MDLEKTMQFIIEQQAQFSADIQQLKEIDAALGKRMDQASQRMDRVEGGIASLLQAQFKQLESVNNVVDSVGRLSQAQQRTEENLDNLAQAQQRTEENLNSLIKIVDGVVRRNN